MNASMNSPVTDILAVRDLEKTFGSLVAARDITVSVPAEQTVGVIGATGVVRVLGERLTAHPAGPATPLRQIVVGTLAGVFGSWFPVIGWVFVLPGLLMTSAGAAILAWVRYRQLKTNA